MQTQTLNEKYLDRLFNSWQLGSGSIPPQSDNSPYTILPIIQGLINDEIKDQLSPIVVAQNVLINKTAEMALAVDALEEETKNFTKTYIENDQLKKKINNINKILSFKKLEAGWNGNNSEPFSSKLIEHALDFINLSNLKYQPSVFPTGRQSIQLEYEKSNGSYLEIEVFEDNYTMYSEMGSDAVEKGNLTIHEILGEINAFHSRF